MVTTRELCDGLSAVLQVPKIERWASCLVRDGFLPHAHEPVDEHEAALLLLTFLGTADLKRELLDLWTEERNAYAKEVMLDIEAQRREGLGVITIRPGSETQQKGAAR